MTESPLTRLARGLLLVAAAVVLLVLVTVAAGGYRLGGSHSAQAPPYAIDTLVSVALALYAIASLAVMVGFFWVGLEGRRSGQVSNRRSPLKAVLGLLVLIALFAAVSGRFHFRLHPFSPDSTSQSAGAAKKHNGQNEKAPPKSHQPRIRALPVGLVFGGVAVGLVALYLSERRRKERLSPDPAVADELAATLEVTLEDLRAERDPRRAVIAAYARMESSLAAHGIPRRRFEAPHEYLERVLDDLTHGGRGARQLTALFERARFSTHEIGPPLKEEAIAAVEGLQAELAGAQLERVA